MNKSFLSIAILIITLALLMLAFSACASPTPPPTPMPTATEPSRITPLPQPTATSTGSLNGETILGSNCTGCHTLERVVSAKKTQEQWDQTVSRMAVRLNNTERATLIDYLAKNYKP
jgi:cytochrome c5